MWKLTFRNLRANLTRLISTAVAVITGTAFVACGLVLTGAIAGAVEGNVAQQYAGVDAAVTPAAPTNDQGPTDLQGVDASLLGPLRDLPQVAAAAGELVAPARILDDNGDAFRSQMLGRAWIVDDALNPFTVVDGRAPQGDGEIAVDRQTSAEHNVDIGKSYVLATPSGPIKAKVVGVTEFGRAASVDGGGTVFFAPDVAIDILGAGSDKFGQILMRTDGSTAELVTAAKAVIPPNDTVLDGPAFMKRATADTQAFVDFLRPVLLGFAFLALFVAGFVIYNTFSVVVTQRSRELALVRSIGGTPAQVRRSLLGEGLLLGFGASVVGMALGVALSWLLGWILEQLDVGLPSAGFSLSPWTAVITLVAGTLITVISVTIPAFRGVGPGPSRPCATPLSTIRVAPGSASTSAPPCSSPEYQRCCSTASSAPIR